MLLTGQRSELIEHNGFQRKISYSQFKTLKAPYPPSVSVRGKKSFRRAPRPRSVDTRSTWWVQVWEGPAAGVPVPPDTGSRGREPGRAELLPGFPALLWRTGPPVFVSGLRPPRTPPLSWFRWLAPGSLARARVCGTGTTLGRKGWADWRAQGRAAGRTEALQGLLRPLLQGPLKNLGSGTLAAGGPGPRFALYLHFSLDITRAKDTRIRYEQFIRHHTDNCRYGPQRGRAGCPGGDCTDARRAAPSCLRLPLRNISRAGPEEAGYGMHRREAAAEGPGDGSRASCRRHTRCRLHRRPGR